MTAFTGSLKIKTTFAVMRKRMSTLLTRRHFALLAGETDSNM